MPEFDLDGFYDGVDAPDDGMDHGDEFEEGFQPFDWMACEMAGEWRRGRRVGVPEGVQTVNS